MHSQRDDIDKQLATALAPAVAALVLVHVLGRPGQHVISEQAGLGRVLRQDTL